ncbi:MAG: succinylglutamate desuccinylase/aspartoacylase family protein [Bryobacteraceae bacterium]
MLSEGWSELLPGVDVFFRKGSEPGPFVLVTAGIHGDEYEGPAAVASLVQQLADLPLTGSIAAIPVANPMAWHGAQRTSPEDGLNLARTFPGKPDGSPTERLASILFDLAGQANYLIDLHSGGVEYLFEPLCGFYGEPELTNPSFAAASHFGLPILWQLPPTDGVLSCELWKRGRSVIGCEYLGAGQLSPRGRDAYERGVLSCLAYWKLLPATFLLPAGGRVCVGDWLLSTAAGIFVAHCAIGEAAAPGQLLAEIHDPRGNTLQSFHAPPSGGLVLAIRSKAYIRPDNWGVLIASNT